MRYLFIHADRTTECVSHYAGKEVVGVATRSTEDANDPKYGEYIAKLRCDRKIALKRAALHAKKIEECEKEMAAIIHKMNKHTEVFIKATKELDDIETALADAKVHL